MSNLRFWEWLQQTPLVAAIANSVLLSTMVEVVHYGSLFLLIGSICMVDLRLLGLAARRCRVADLADGLFPLLWSALILNFLSGFLLFAGDASELVDNWVFQIKLVVILLAVACSVLVQRGVRKWALLPGLPVSARLFALVSLVLWIASLLAAVELPSLTSVG